MWLFKPSKTLKPRLLDPVIKKYNALWLRITWSTTYGILHRGFKKCIFNQLANRMLFHLKLRSLQKRHNTLKTSFEEIIHHIVFIKTNIVLYRSNDDFNVFWSVSFGVSAPLIATTNLLQIHL